jgi:FMN phosphatase YigB (HAD superfamily)
MKNIDTIIWDLDNTLYKFDSKMMVGWNYQAARYFVETGFHLPMNDTQDLVNKGWEEYGNSIHYFTKDYGYEKSEVCKFVDSNLCTSYVSACDVSPLLFKELKPYKHLILTMAPSKWAFKVLNHISLKNHFEDDHIIGAEQYDFEHKSESPRGIKMALERAQSNAANTLFVEDTLANLKTAKIHTGVQTAYLHHDRPYNVDDVRFADVIVRDTPELLKFLKDKEQ